MNKKSTISNTLYYLSFWLLLFVTFLGRVYIISDICKYIKYIALGIATIEFFTQSKSYPTKTFLLLIFIGIILLISSSMSKNIELISTFLLIAASKNIDFHKLVKFVFKWSLIFLTLVLLLHFIGYTDDFIDIRANGVYRNSMGFAHPNTFGYILMMIAIEYFYIKKEKIKIRDAILLIPYIAIINYFSNSRAAMAILLLLIIFIIFEKIICTKILYKKPIKFIIEHSFIIIFIITTVALNLYSNSSDLGLTINNLLSRRLYWLDFYVNNYPITLLGQKVEIISIKLANSLNISYTALDNAYYYILLNYGIIPFIIISISFKKIITKLYESHATIEILLILLINIYGIFENTIIMVNLNCFLILFKILIYERNKVSINETK